MSSNGEMKENCLESFQVCIQSLRLGREGRFGRSFVRVIDCISTLVADASDTNQVEVAQLLQEAMQCQVAHNNIRLADILEYEILPCLMPDEMMQGE